MTAAVPEYKTPLLRVSDARPLTASALITYAKVPPNPSYQIPTSTAEHNTTSHIAVHTAYESLKSVCALPGPAAHWSHRRPPVTGSALVIRSQARRCTLPNLHHVDSNTLVAVGRAKRLRPATASACQSV